MNPIKEKLNQLGLLELSDKQTLAAISGMKLKDGNAFSRIKQAAERRVDIVMMGDSNQLKDGYGFTRGIDMYLSERYGQYASPIYFNNGYCGLVGQQGQLPNYTDEVTDEHADLFLEARTTLTEGISENIGILTPYGTFIDSLSDIRYWFAWASTTEGSGEFTMQARVESAPWTIKAKGDPIQTNTGEVSLHLSHLDVTSEVFEATGKTIKGGLSGNTPVVGPLTALYQRAEAISTDTGVSCSTLYGVGGDSLREMAIYLKEATDTQLTNYFAETRRLQLSKGYDPIVVVYINSAVNDRNESEISVGTYATEESRSPKGYLENVVTCINRIEAIWALNGWDKTELSFLLIASHVIANPNDSQLTEYRAELTNLAKHRNNLTTVDLSERMDYDTALAGNWYLGEEWVHLVPVGYDEVTKLLFQDLL